ncbi:MAG: hypothetical protein JWN34_5009 [Bryobacterales bacterium]|nr:hypothetical protein [Bryobacterales bacterium]
MEISRRIRGLELRLPAGRVYTVVELPVEIVAKEEERGRLNSLLPGIRRHGRRDVPLWFGIDRPPVAEKEEVIVSAGGLREDARRRALRQQRGGAEAESLEELPLILPRDGDHGGRRRAPACLASCRKT